MLGYPTEIFCNIEVAGGRVWIKPEGIKYFAGDLSEQEQKLVWATHYPPAADLLEQQKLDKVAWKSKPGCTSSLRRIRRCIPIFSAFWRNA